LTSRISFNVHGSNVTNPGRLKYVVTELQPAALLVLDNLDLARELKVLVPNCNVIYRHYGSNGDGDLHKQMSPQDWINTRKADSYGGIRLHVMNEPSFDQSVITWLTELLRLAAPLRLPLIIGNWAVGNPLPEQWPMAKTLLQLLDQNRDLFQLGLHEYAGGVVTSGLYGGYPDNAGVQPGTPGGVNLIQPANWPNDVSAVTRYHMGRFKFLVDYCKSVGMNPPRIVLTEHGFDDTSDIKAWEDTLTKTDPYLNIRGFKTLVNQWRNWYGGLGWSTDAAYFEQLKWANEKIYKNSPVEAQCVFCWGHSSQQWDMFDISLEHELQDKLIIYAKSGVPPVTDTMPDISTFEEYAITTNSRLRRGAGTAFTTIVVVPEDARIRVSKKNTVLVNGYTWHWTIYGKEVGRMALVLPFDQQFVLPTVTYTFPVVITAANLARIQELYAEMSDDLKSLYSAFPGDNVGVGALTQI
jgi:hypothetical protein